jgi:hypothetical protein
LPGLFLADLRKLLLELGSLLLEVGLLSSEFVNPSL